MFMTTKIVTNEYTRCSKTGILHTYKRKKTFAVFACDNCGSEFERCLKNIQKKRLSNNYFHCCPACDSKRFAQRKGVERKKIWDMPAGLDLPINKY